ncbi:energy transducer TonB [Sulfurospirillum multivorans]|uniref:Periplasmic binding protein TonB domain-containing protein n=2 Tax=Sulfurospirillum multivorans TaxID=66821 RepID=A0AA86AMD9_SULMK|nr:TonB family protein [Sulfurospirillum multivorans]AHJ13124.1 periplasmic binding protein TonB domain-containing protein [Sulfurospirillum multivorans DSM 12446]
MRARDCFMDDSRSKRYDIIGFSLSIFLHVTVALILFLDFSFIQKPKRHQESIQIELIEIDRIITAPIQEEKRALPNESKNLDTTGIVSEPKKISEKDFEANTKHPIEKIDFELIKRKILANLIFPPIAQQNAWFGTVQLAITINEMGQLVSSKINQTSGKKIFDDVVLMAVEKLKFDVLPKPSVTSTLLFDIEFTR